ncbi:hypothetical protein HDU81_007732 [Chytriomyces hyalinus]|nr:hypothetical protein HDU81_007732 [Chytriomyces hyalinus]
MGIVLVAVVIVICSIAASAVAAWREHQRVQKLRREDSLRGPRRRVLNPATAIASSPPLLQSTIAPPTISKERESLYRDDIAPMKSHQLHAYTSFSANTPLAASLDRTLAHLDSKKFAQNSSQPTKPYTNNAPAQQLYSSNATSAGTSNSVDSHQERRSSRDNGTNAAKLSATFDDFKETRTVISSNASLKPQIQVEQVASSSARTLEISSPSPFIAQPGSVGKRRRQGAALVSNEEALNSRLSKIRKANAGGSNPSTPQQKSLLKQALKSSAPTSTPKRKHPKNAPSSKVATPSTGSKRKQITYEDEDEDSLKLEDLDHDPVAISQRLKKEQAEMPIEDGWLTPLSYHHKKRRLTMTDEDGILGKEDVEPITYVNPSPQIAPGSTSRNRIRMSGGTPLKEAQRREHQLHVTKAPTPLLRKPLSAEAVQTLISETLGDDVDSGAPISNIASKGSEDANGTPFALRKVKFADEAGGSLEAGPSPFGGVKGGAAPAELLAPPKFPGFGSAGESKSVEDASGFSTSTPDAGKLSDNGALSIGGFRGFSTPSKGGDVTSANGNLFVGLAEKKAEESKSSDAPKTSISFGFGAAAPVSAEAPAIGINSSAAASETKSSVEGPSQTKFPSVVEPKETSAPKPAMSFSFGTPAAPSKPESTTNSDKQPLSFGASSNAAPAIPGFSGFGSSSPKADSKPAISFGGFGSVSGTGTATKDSETKTGGISFGGLNSSVKTAEPTAGATVPSATSFAGFGSLEKKDPAPAAGGFSFGSSAEPAAPATGGFSFGTTAAPTSSAPSDTAPKTGGFSFGNAAPAFSSAPAAAPSSFGATVAGTEPTKPSNGFSFGAPAAAPTEPTKVGGFSFGTPAPAKETAAAPSFNFGAPSAPATNPTAATAAPATSFNFGSLGTSTATTGGSGFSMGNTATPAATPFGAAPTSLSFGASSATPGFGAAPASQPAAPASGVQFGGLGAQNTQNAATPFGSAQTSTGFGSAPTASSAAPFGTGAFGAQPASSGFGGFGSTGQTGAGPFGSTPAAAPAAAFGSQNAVSSFGAAASGFGGFGATPSSAAPPTTGGFGAASSANAFGNGFASNSNPPASSSSFNFGSNSTTSAAPSSGSAPAFSFGNTSSSFGNAAPVAGASSFGGGAQSSSFQFGASNAPASTATPFGAAPQSQPSFAFGSAPQQQPQQGGFGFGSQASGAPSSTGQAMFSFGSNSGGAAPASAPAGGGMFNLGSNSAAPENRMDRKLAQPKRPLGGRRPAAGTRPR